MVVGFVESIHAVRAVEPMQRLGWDVHVVASHPHWPHPAWRDVTLHVDPGFEPSAPAPGVTVKRLEPPPGDPEPVVEGLSWRQRPEAVAALIREIEPDLIDSMEIQHGGYVVLEARERLQRPPPWIVHNWGSDVYYFGRNPRHAEPAEGGVELLRLLRRRVSPRRRPGPGLRFLAGASCRCFPTPADSTSSELRGLRRSGPASERRVLALKATESFVYRPDTAIAALERCADLLDGYTLELYTASDVRGRGGPTSSVGGPGWT